MNGKFNQFIKRNIWPVGCGVVTEALLWFWVMHIGLSACSVRNLIEEIVFFSQWPGLLLFCKMVNAPHTFLGIPISNNLTTDWVAEVVWFSTQVLVWSAIWWMVFGIKRLITDPPDGRK